MKQILLSTLLFLFSFASLFAQISFSSNSAIVEMGEQSDFEVVAHASFTNNSSETVTVIWERTAVSYSNENWKSLVCDVVTCFPPQVSTNTLTLGAGESSNLDIHFQGNGIEIGEGVGHVQIAAWVDGETETSFVADFYGVTSAPGIVLAGTNPVFEEGEGSVFEIVAHSTFINTTDETLTVVWERLSEDFGGADWRSLVCDLTTCFPPQVTTNSFTLAPGEISNLDVHFQNNGAAEIGMGEGMVEMMVTTEENPDYGFTATYEARAYGVGIEEEDFFNTPTFEGEANLYPNPVRNNDLTIEFNPNSNIKHIELYNLLGKRVAVYDIADSYQKQIIEACDLDEGMYFVSMFNETGDLVTTKTFTKIN
ncbi:MAG: T9SS type A sorting domain-containing protein [Chitinophagales bacterium]